ncbi:DUF3324 domain-containing protein [Xylocopilactobacillus apis]|uniref:Cell surface protein n=1 Tax=Xylocopilactobacillus apis TaxID=2932183 RepID=A0AAU9D0U3_9LACO|nr:DUF3324 domain-containing protein [Xylocopilactobacillus apis]BDR57294.1 cell surface protein [Xylocopilactobacillus apis]
MRKARKIFLILFIGIVFNVFNEIPAFAANNTNGGYSIRPIPPKNQNPAVKGYFDLTVVPGQRQSLSIEVNNNSNETKTIRVLATTAATTSFMDTNYDGEIKSKDKDKSLKYDFSRFGFTPKTIKLRPNSKLVVPLDFTVPKKPFKGIVLGGIYVSDVNAQNVERNQSGKTGMKLKNYLNYAIAVKMTEDQETEVTPNLKISGIKAILYSGYPAAGVTLRNTSMGFGSTVSAKATTYLKKDRKIRATGKVSSGTIAPNTIFTYPIMFPANKRITPGKYHLDLKIKTATRNFKFSRDYTISPTQADLINKYNPSIKKSYLWIIILAIVIGILLLVLSFALFFIMGRGRGRQESNAGFPQNMDGMQKKQFKQMMREQKKQFKAQQKAMKKRK